MVAMIIMLRPACGCSQVTTRTKKNELRDVAVIKTDATTIRFAIFSNLEPNDIVSYIRSPTLSSFEAPTPEAHLGAKGRGGTSQVRPTR